MARATRRGAAPVAPVKEPTPQTIDEAEGDDQELSEEDAEDQLEEDPNLPSIEFSEQLNWKAGKSIVVGELIRRLSKLHKELSETEQGGIRPSSLLPVAQQLAHHQLLHHKDKGVEAWVAVCLVDVFKMLAPDAPYQGKQLKDIFTLFIDNIIPSLARPQGAYDDLRLYVLQNLTQLKLLTLLIGLPGADGLVVRLYIKAFDMFSAKTPIDADSGPSRSVLFLLTEALSGLASHYEDNLPKGVVDVILAQFLRADPKVFALQFQKTSTNDPTQDLDHSRQMPPSYSMAQNICSMSSEIMTRAISQYFSSVIIDASDAAPPVPMPKSNGKRRRGSEDVVDTEDEVAGVTTDEQLKDLHKAHRLLRELWRACPDVTQAVVLQVDAELAAENTAIRVIATETIGDMVAGIGAAGPPPAPILDPAAYPSIALEETRFGHPKGSSADNLPASQQPFSTVHPSIYKDFMNRRLDKSPQVRSVYATCLGRILSTSAGGLGLDQKEQSDLLSALAEVLLDSDDKVRLAAIKAVAFCGFDTIVRVIGSTGGVSDQGSVLFNLADRIRDRKHTVRGEAMKLLGRLWGVSSGAIAGGSEKQHELFGPIPSKILEATYINDPELTCLIVDTLFSKLLPISFPPIKSKKESSNSQSSRRRQESLTESSIDPDAVRAGRILILVNDLSEKARTVFFTLQQRQVQNARVLDKFVQHCETYNGGVAAKNATHDFKDLKMMMNKMISFFAREFTDPMTASDHLWKLVKKNDRRLCHLMRCATSADKDYKIVERAIKEITNRLTEQGRGTAETLATLMPILQKSSLIVYNKSHVPTIMDFARTDEQGLGSVSHEVLKEILHNHPEVLQAHVRGICEVVVNHAPEPGQVSDVGTVKTLKACASFAQRDPSAMPDDRAFLQSMVKFALHGQPPKAAKHAVTVIVSLQKKKDMYVRDVVTDCIDSFKYGKAGFLSKLAALSQLSLLAANDIDDQNDRITAIAIKEVLLRKSEVQHNDDKVVWKDEIDDDCMAQILALKILVNRLRYYASATSDKEMESSMAELVTPVYKMLRSLIRSDDDLSSAKPRPAFVRSRLRLTAAKSLLKLSCASKFLDQCLGPQDFQQLALITQDGPSQVRSGFFRALKKYLTQSALPSRFYAPVFVMAFEPEPPLKDEVMSWLRARATALAKVKDTTMELTLARFISILAHHPDFSMDLGDLKEFPEYILFYLKIVATKTNLPLIYHVAQRIKSVQDGIDREIDENLYCLSEMAQAIIREYAEIRNWQLPAWTGKFGMPAGIFEQLSSHSRAQEIADAQYAPKAILESIEEIVRENVKGKKRRAETTDGQSRKRSKPSGNKSRPVNASSKNTRQKRRNSDATSPADMSERRRSARASETKSYAGMDESEDEDEGEGEDTDHDEHRVDTDGVNGDATRDEVAIDDDKENHIGTHPRSRLSSGDNGRTIRARKSAVKPTIKTKTKTGQSRRGTRKVAKHDEDDDDELSDAPSSIDEDEGIAA